MYKNACSERRTWHDEAAMLRERPDSPAVIAQEEVRFEYPTPFTRKPRLRLCLLQDAKRART